MNHMRSFWLITLLLLGNSLAGSQDRPASETIPYGPFPQDLANALARIARSSHVPIIAELAQPLQKVSVTESGAIKDYTLNQLVKQVPGYEWRQEGKAVHFYNKKLRHARFNFLNLPFKSFTMPRNLSEMKLWFSTREIGLLQGFTGEGGAITGLGDAELEKQQLQQVTLENVTGLEILLRVANDSPTFFTVIVFPNETPTKKQAEERVTLNWFWRSLNEKPAPLYVQPLGRGRHPTGSSVIK